MDDFELLKEQLETVLKKPRDKERRKSVLDGFDIKKYTEILRIGEEVEGWQMYTEYRGGEPVAYRYGPEWVAMQLYMEGGFKTPEEAKAAWLREWEKEYKHG